MDFQEFKTKRIVLKKEFRAVCYSNNKHWQSIWMNTFEEAFGEAERHRTLHPNYAFHDIRIEEKVIRMANIFNIEEEK